MVSYWPTAFLDSIIFNEYKYENVSEYIISNSKNVAYATDLAIGRTKNEESGNGVHLQPLAFLKLALELTFLLLLTLNHNKECKSLSNTLGNYNLDVGYH